MGELLGHQSRKIRGTLSVGNSARKLLIWAPRAGFEPATLRLTAEIDVVCWTLPSRWPALAESGVRRDERGLKSRKTFAGVCRTWPAVVAAKGQEKGKVRSPNRTTELYNLARHASC